MKNTIELLWDAIDNALLDIEKIENEIDEQNLKNLDNGVKDLINCCMYYVEKRKNIIITMNAKVIKE